MMDRNTSSDHKNQAVGDDFPFFLRPAYRSEKGMRDMKGMMMVLEVPGRCELGELKSSREWVIPSCLTQIQPVVREALAELGERTDLDAVELALHEALVNAIEPWESEIHLQSGACDSGPVQQWWSGVGCEGLW